MLSIFLGIFQVVLYQTDWMGGDRVLGPVNDWRTQYWSSDSVTVATPGQVSLIATDRDYSNWVKHIVESNSGIGAHAQGLMPCDIDGDSILDLVAHTQDTVVWYKHDGYYNFLKNIIGPADDGGHDALCVYPSDIDCDGDIDVLVATRGIGCGWYENQNLSWIYHSLDDSFGYHRICATDIEGDKDIDVIAVDNAGAYPHYGDIYLFRNNGSQVFTKEQVATLPSYEGWRVHFTDFNRDGQPDIYSVNNHTYIFLNDSLGNFTLSFNADLWAGEEDFDGAYPSDIDMDGDMDLICGVHIYNTIAQGFYAFLNDGTGNNFTSVALQGTEVGGKDYGDGAISCDIDMDGLPDVIGALYNVGYFRQDPNNPLNFILHEIDDITYSHWVYTASISCKCTPSMDLLVTDEGAHIVYENQMLKLFASFGYLESSIIRLASDSVCTLKYFGYNACVPNDTALAFYFREGIDSTDIINNPWNGPYWATRGVNVIDSFTLDWTACVFQYKVEFRGGDDIGVLYEVWLDYRCGPLGIEEMPVEAFHKRFLQFADEKLILYLPYGDEVELVIYDACGRLVENVFKGYLPSGRHEFEVYEKPGIYFAKVISHRGKTENLKFIILK